MSDDIERPDWQDGAPEDTHTSFRDLGSSDTWVPDGGDLEAGAKSITGVKEGSKILTSGGKIGDAFGNVDSLTDWDGLFSAGTTLIGEANEIADQVGKFMEGATKIAEDPKGWLAGTIVDFLLEIFDPLDDLLQLLTGNEAIMKNSAEMWNAASDGCPQIGDYVVESGHAAIQGWGGDASQAARTRISEVGMAMHVMGYGAVAMKHIMTQAAELAKAAYDQVKKLLAEGVEWVLTRVAAYLAASWATFGAAVPVAIADTVRKVMSLLMTAFNFVKRAISIFTNMVKSCQGLQMIVDKVKPVLEKLQKIQKAYDSNKGMINAGVDLAGQAFK
ncbi:hypothetical protein [Glycomyces salinus]|uniref:hypothetical protein n=1 Tax=Glycomyces salinus TaxID=980294 RepID=UPI0018EDFEDC|nr:hypothetical protein [Glycomyces salinus]